MKQNTLERYLRHAAKSATSSNEALLPCEDGQSKEKIEYIITVTGKYMYNIDQVEKILG